MEQKEELLGLIRVHSHPKITPEIRREILQSRWGFVLYSIWNAQIKTKPYWLVAHRPNCTFAVGLGTLSMHLVGRETMVLMFPPLWSRNVCVCVCVCVCFRFLSDRCLCAKICFWIVFYLWNFNKWDCPNRIVNSCLSLRRWIYTYIHTYIYMYTKREKKKLRDQQTKTAISWISVIILYLLYVYMRTLSIRRVPDSLVTTAKEMHTASLGTPLTSSSSSMLSTSATLI